MTSSMMAASTSSKGSGVQLTFKKAMGISIGNSSQPVNSPAPSSSSSFSTASSSSSGPLVATGGVIPGNTAANPYIEGQGMGRGKHLTKPSWSGGDGNNSASLESVTEHSSSAAPSSSAMKLNSDQFDDAPLSGTSKGSAVSVAPKRSRFSASTSPLEGISVTALQPPPHSDALYEGHQVTEITEGGSNNHPSNITVASAKRSRWDQ
jgi:hypothetical protein